MGCEAAAFQAPGSMLTFLRNMDPIAFVRAQLRKDNPASRKAAGLIRSLLNLRVPPTALHRVLLDQASQHPGLARREVRGHEGVRDHLRRDGEDRGGHHVWDTQFDVQYIGGHRAEYGNHDGG